MSMTMSKLRIEHRLLCMNLHILQLDNIHITRCVTRSLIDTHIVVAWAVCVLLHKAGAYTVIRTSIVYSRVSRYGYCVVCIGRASGSRYTARLRAIGAYWGLSETIEDWTQE